MYIDPSGHGVISNAIKKVKHAASNVFKSIFKKSKNAMIDVKVEINNTNGSTKVSNAPGCRYGECSTAVSDLQYSKDLTDEMKKIMPV